MDDVSASLHEHLRHYCALGRFEEAEKIAQHLLNHDVNDPAPNQFLSSYYLNQGLVDKASEHSKRCTRVCADSELTWLHECLVAFERDEVERFCTAMDCYLRMSSNRIYIYFVDLLNCVLKKDLPNAAKRLSELRGMTGDFKQTSPYMFSLIKRLRVHIQELTLGNLLNILRESVNIHCVGRIVEAFELFYADRPYRFPLKNQKPSFFYVPGLTATPWHRASQFPWSRDIQASAESIYQEYLHALSAGQLHQPYVTSEFGAIPKEWEALAAGQWQSIHLYKGGAQTLHTRLFPLTCKLISSLPLPRCQTHSPEVFFSLLKARTSIPPHFGLSNFKLVTHLPLKIPRDCVIKVGGIERNWEPGELLMFDDSFVHEAHNSGGDDRLVLIFDTWHPDLIDEEKLALELGFRILSRYYGVTHFTG